MTEHEVLDDGPVDLPPYRAVLVVDTKEFGGNDDPDQELLARNIRDVLIRAFERAGLAEVWDEALFPQNTGDGYGIAFDTRHLPAVVSRFFDVLQEVLTERDARWRARGRQLRMRMRASLNVGPVRDPHREEGAVVVGKAVITTHRLLDTEPVRDVLTRSDPDQTFLSVALSQRVFDDVVAAGYATLSASRLVSRFVQVKEFSGKVYLYVPKPSGDLLEHGVAEATQDSTAQSNDLRAVQATRRSAPGSSTNMVRGGVHTGATIQVGHLHGGFHNK
ncbi:hypothetical protein ACFQ1S_09755 [Kibdelosporangium lantanae]|uniref:Guanylate cyclase domain-containing protein n=1 Tax=Kibdelosporangium lantanae TaxID=1497396 RepID=A0ABW3M541_9PSEU